MEDIVKQTVTRNLLKYAAGRAITCRCGQILDAKTTVLVDTTALCASCYEQVRERIPAGTEVVDGRIWFAVPSRKPRAKRAPRKEGAGPRVSFRALYTGYIKRLRELGCVFCPTCYAYLDPTHTH